MDTLFRQVLINHNIVISGKHLHNVLLMLAHNSTLINLFFTPNSEIPEDVSSLREFTTAMIVAATSKCLRLIKDDLQIPSVLPASMSSKFRLGTTLATACQVCLVKNLSFTHSFVPQAEIRFGQHQELRPLKTS